MQVLSDRRTARARGLLVLLDAKRGDIGSTAEAYAAAYLARRRAAPRGRAHREPLSRPRCARALRATRPSARAPGSSCSEAHQQPRRRATPGPRRRSGAPSSSGRRALAASSPRGPRPAGPGSASSPGHPPTRRAPARAPAARLFLVPGYGAQGGAPRDAVAGFVPGAGRPPRGRRRDFVARASLPPPARDSGRARAGSAP